MEQAEEEAFPDFEVVDWAELPGWGGEVEAQRGEGFFARGPGGGGERAKEGGRRGHAGSAG